MKKPWPIQIVILASLALVIGIANNFRPKAKIEWVRDWPPFSSLSASEETSSANSSHQMVETKNTDVMELDAEDVANLVASNAGITDIELATAASIFKYGSEFTFWIDARSPELYDKGHIQGAALLHLYEKNEYLPTVERQIQEKQPLALVVYCRGLDCTDSHHLAQDLQAIGYENIFVYKGGFQEWYEAKRPIEGELATGVGPQHGTPEDLPEQVAGLVTSNIGITDIELETAYQIFRFANDYTLWIDARSPELFKEGHIQGAELLHLYEKNEYLPLVEARIVESQPVALVIYCRGKDCTDSHHLAQDLSEIGYENLFVYKGGYQEWYKAGYPVVGNNLAIDDQSTQEAFLPRIQGEKPPGMYLEHVIRDLLPFVMGLLFLLFWRKTLESKALLISAAVVVGLFFIYAAYPKLINPFLFAKNIWNYDIAPSQIINISALVLPAIELVAGLCLVFGIYRKGGSLIINVLLGIFIMAISFNILRGHEFNCGCTSTATYLTDTYLVGWNEKVMLLLRDFGLLAMSILTFKGER